MILSACADTSADCEPILDGDASASFQSDLQACQGLAHGQTQIDQQTIRSAAGCVLGATIAAHGGGGTAVEGLVGGALVGPVCGLSKSKDKREMIVAECMKGRGHHVVGYEFYPAPTH